MSEKSKHLVFTTIFILIIAGALVPVPYITPYSIPDPSFHTAVGINRASWFAAMIFGWLFVMSAFVNLSKIVESEKTEEGKKDSEYLKLMTRDTGAVGALNVALGVLIAFSCAYAGWWFLALVWLVAEALAMTVRHKRAEFKARNIQANTAG